MSLQVQASYTVPEETARVARAIFPHGTPYLQLYDTFGKLFQDQDFAALFSPEGLCCMNLAGRRSAPSPESQRYATR